MFTKDMIIGEVLETAKNPEAVAAVLTGKFGMHCLQCPCSRGETIAEAAEVHSVDADAMLAALNEADK